MNEFERLIAYLKIAYNNMSTLHRHLTDDAGWFGNHEKLGDWYADIADQLDDLTEIGLALGYSEPSIKDAVLQFGGDVLDTGERKLPDTLRTAAEIMRSMAGMMGTAKELVPPDVQNKLDEYAYTWDKIANYMISHALGGGRQSEEDDD